MIPVRRYQVRPLGHAVPVELCWNRLAERFYDPDPLFVTGDTRSRRTWPPGDGSTGREPLRAHFAGQRRTPWRERRLPPTCRCRSRSTWGPHGPGIFARRKAEAARVDVNACPWNSVSDAVQAFQFGTRHLPGLVLVLAGATAGAAGEAEAGE